MPMIGPKMAAAVQGVMASQGNIGSNLPVFSLAVGMGSVMSVVGKTFNTLDTGVSPGAGVGVGVGLQGVSSAAISAAIQAAYFQEFGMMGPTLPMMADAIGQGLEAELLLATLTSSHSPVYAGSGVIVPGSIPLSDSEWASNIKSAAPALLGEDWPRLCSVIGKGCVQAMAPATGTVVISGGGTPPPVPVAGAPNGITPSGVIS